MISSVRVVKYLFLKPCFSYEHHLLPWTKWFLRWKVAVCWQSYVCAKGKGRYLIKIKPLPNENSNTFTKWVCKPAHSLLSCTNASKELYTLTPQLQLQALFYENILIKSLQKMAHPIICWAELCPSPVLLAAGPRGRVKVSHPCVIWAEFLRHLLHAEV